ncbi:NAD(P)H-dependent oxidoreductase [Aquipuribacter hungaricus]|uniref:NAD(P)H-dependent oxidoreductase n=1 Tax=Aquipuribacter hungaricus TaxID=545624 RepID=A0ABV7WDY9_9MICO
MTRSTDATPGGTLVLTAHPDSTSLTHHAARRLRDLLGPDDVTVAHLAQEGFDPRWTLADRRAYLGQATPGPDVLAEHRRVDQADHLVLVFPVQWWSLPALLKGWVDRVLVAGWAFDLDEDGTVVPRLQRLTVHLLPLSGTSAGSFDRHGYTRSFRTQLEQGVVGYCGARAGVTAFVHDSESGDREAVAAAVDRAAGSIATSITGTATSTSSAGTTGAPVVAQEG